MTLKRISFVYLSSLVLSISSIANEVILEIDRKYMNKDWSFLPDVPLSFDKNQSKEIKAGLNYKKFKLNISKSNVALDLNRFSEPKSVSLNAKKKELSIGYLFNNDDYLYLINTNQESDNQTFNCYEFSSIILGFCDSADLQITSTNPKYESLGDNVIKISGLTESIGMGYFKNFNSFWLESISFELINTSYAYNWISPLEDIQSSVILNLDFNGIKLGDALETAFSRLPQREEWESLQLNLGIKQKFYSIYNFNIIAEYDLIFLDFSNYAEYKMAQDVNLRIRGGIEFYFENLSLLFYGDAYLNNLIGFEPITFNQRTEHYFDEPYGELGIKFKINL